MKIDTLVVGASGLVGRILLNRLGSRAHGTGLTNAVLPLFRLDITDSSAVAAELERLRPKHVIVSAAFTNVNACETDEELSRRVNVEGPRNVARACTAIGASCVFLSTDYVFGGDTGPHPTTETPAPLNVYGRHKLEAEAAVANECERSLIVRACNIYGWQSEGMNFVMACWRLGSEGKAMRVPFDQWGNPTHADDLAEAVVRALDRELTGIVHFAGPDYVDRLVWARRSAAAFGLDASFVEGVATQELNQAAPRPLRGGLDASDTERLVDLKFAGLEEGLARVVRDKAAAGD
ncbi:MAG: dTDP-4-dehydrorhamnose reductase [Hyphomicrobiaceae bacterium]|jgi:dTDP-4-dehydrorhamnose reductase